MTIYYVDPWAGNDANTGLSWAQAWKDLPTANSIVAGDEVRFAKSPTYNTTSTTSQSLAFASGYMYQNFASGVGVILANTTGWVANSTYSSSGGNGVTLKTNTVVPANVLLGYQTISHTSSIYKSFYQLINTTNMVGGARGTRIRVALCSDTLGATPVIWLDGHVASTGYAFRVAFTYDSPTTLSLSIGSVALYSGSLGFTTGASAPIVAMYTNMFIGVDRKFGMVLPGEAFQKVDFRLSSSSHLAAQDVMTATQLDISNGNFYTYFYPYYPLESDANASVFLVYTARPLVTGSEVSTGRLYSFTGAAGNPIKITGGWNTSTELQDGFTNLAYEGGPPQNYGAFQFTNGTGDYLEFHRVFSTHQGLVGFPNATSAAMTLNSLVVKMSCVGGVTNGSDAAVIAVNSANNSFTLSFFEATDSLVYTTARLVRRGANASTAVAWSSDALKYGTIDIIDSMAGTYFSTQNNLRILTAIKIRGVTNYSYIVNRYVTSNFHANTATAAYDILIEKCAVYANANGSTPGMYFGDHNAPTARSYGTITFRNICSLIGQSNLGTNYYGTVVIDGMAGTQRFSAISNSSPCVITVNQYWSSTDGLANNPNSSVTLKGTFTSATGAGKMGVIVNHTANLIVDPTFSTPSPVGVGIGIGLHLRNCRSPNGKISFTNCYFSSVGLEVPAYTGYMAGLQITTPDHYGYVFTNCYMTLKSNYPLGWVKLVGCTLYSGTLPTWVANESVAEAAVGGLVAYGCTLSGGYLRHRPSHYAYQFSGNYVTASPRLVSIFSGLKGNTEINASSYTGSSYPQLCSFDCRVEPGYTIGLYSPAAMYDYYYQRPMFITNGTGFIYAHRYNYVQQAGTALNAYDQYDTTIRGGYYLGKIQVKGGQNVAISVVVRSTTKGVFRLTINPDNAFAADIDSHVMFRSIRTINTDLPFVHNIAPTADGTLDVYLYSASQITLRKFTVTVS